MSSMVRLLLGATVCCLLLALVGTAAGAYSDYYYASDFDPHDSGAADYDYGSYGPSYPSAYDYTSGYDEQSDDYGGGHSDLGYSVQQHGGAGSPYRAHRGDRQRYRHRYYSRPTMVQYAKSYQRPKPKKEYVPVVIKKKTQKKKKILTTHHGFFIPGGTAMFGKFKDLHSCMKACEITPTCFGGDFNPWLGKCFLHSNLTACASMRSHKAITHFKKVPCNILESTRGFIVLGASVTGGIEIKGIDTLQDCIKKCATAGGGIAPLPTEIGMTPQICCNLDYDFATHKCYFHMCVNMAIAVAQFCAMVPEAPLNSIGNPSAITISLCPLAAV